MIPKKSRLPRSGFKESGYRFIKTPFFSLKVKDRASPGNRIGVIVGKSVDKRATKRNFLERQVKSQLRRLPETGKDLIVNVFPKAGTLTKKQFTEEVQQILKKAYSS